MNFKGLQLLDSEAFKCIRSEDYNWDFNKVTGEFLRWGRDEADDPQWGLPEVADIEISRDGCIGYGTQDQPKVCRYCYKSNTNKKAHNMSLATFKIVLGKLGRTITQVAFGITSIHANPDFLAIMQHCRESGVVPNFTTTGADLDEEFLSHLPGLVGAVAVSYHGDKELCFNTVKRLLDAGIKQTNIHCVTNDYQTVFDFILATSEKMRNGLALNALVLLSLKSKGRAKNLKNITEEQFKHLVNTARELGVPLGFDSCSAHRAASVFEPEYHSMIEPCESGLFSLYIDADGMFHPCSFSEGEWGDGIDVVNCDHFRDIWLSERVTKWRKALLENGRNCPLKF